MINFYKLCWLFKNGLITKKCIQERIQKKCVLTFFLRSHFLFVSNLGDMAKMIVSPGLLDQPKPTQKKKWVGLINLSHIWFDLQRS